jgi:hypothetical protein
MIEGLNLYLGRQQSAKKERFGVIPKTLWLSTKKWVVIHR